VDLECVPVMSEGDCSPKKMYRTTKDKTWSFLKWGKDKITEQLVCCGIKKQTLDALSVGAGHGFVKGERDAKKISSLDNQFLNRAIVFSWPFFAAYLCLQPWISNWANNRWWNYSAGYTVYNRDGSVQNTTYGRHMCDTPAQLIHCSDGQNFTALAIAARGAPIGCGCGQGVLGEGLCPMTFYGYTLSDYVSTEPGIAAMLGLGFFPLLGTWRNTMFINKLAKPTMKWQYVHLYSMLAFQIAYLIWGMASDCIFPNTHSIFTVLFLGAFMVHWIVTALICTAFMGIFSIEDKTINVESLVTINVAIFAVAIISLGAIPRIFITLNDTFGTTFFPNLNFFPFSYAFWLAEAVGLSATFGAYPVVITTAYFFPEYSDFNNDHRISEEEAELFQLFRGQFGDKSVRWKRTSSADLPHWAQMGGNEPRRASAREVPAMCAPLLMN